MIVNHLEGNEWLEVKNHYYKLKWLLNDAEKSVSKYLLCKIDYFESNYLRPYGRLHSPSPVRVGHTVGRPPAEAGIATCPGRDRLEAGRPMEATASSRPKTQWVKGLSIQGNRGIGIDRRDKNEQ